MRDIKKDKVIFFDMSGIFNDLNIKRNIKEFEKQKNLKENSVYESVHDRPYWKEFSMGRISEKKYQKLVETDYFKNNNINLDMKELRKSFIRAKNNESMIKYVKELSKDFRIGIITNSAKEWFIEFKKEIGIKFDFEIVSGINHLRKPDKEIFLFAANKAKTSPKDCIYIDDREEMLVGAKIAGFDTLTFKDVKQIKRELEILLKQGE